MGWESSGVRFDLWPLLQGQMMVHWLWRVVFPVLVVDTNYIGSPMRRSSYESLSMFMLGFFFFFFLLYISQSSKQAIMAEWLRSIESLYCHHCGHDFELGISGWHWYLGIENISQKYCGDTLQLAA